MVKSDVVATVAVVRAAAALVLPFADLTTKRTFYQFANWVRSQRFRFVNRACVAYSLQTGRLKRPVCRLRVSVCRLSRRRLRPTNSRGGTHQGAIAMARGTHDLLLHAEHEDEGVMSLPLMQRLKLEEQLHEADMQKLRSEQVARELKIECKAADRARRKEEKTSQQQRVECTALVQRLHAQHQQHQQLARQHEELSHVSSSHAKKLAKLTEELKEQAGQMAAQSETLHRSDQRAAERQQLILQQHQQLSMAAEQERARMEAQERATQAAELELAAARRAAQRAALLEERQVHLERESTRVDGEVRRYTARLAERDAELGATEVQLAEARAQLILRTTEAGAWRKHAEAAEARAAASADAHARTEALLQVAP